MADVKIGFREIGILIIAVSILLLGVLAWFINFLSDASTASCTCGDSCDMVHFEIPLVFYIGVFGLIIMMLIGIVLIFKGGSIGRSEASTDWMDTLSRLEEDEKTVYKMIIDADGTMFQSEIVEKTGLTKVKVTRVLDRLESRRLLERRRRGLTNIVVLK